MSYECIKADRRRQGLMADWENWLKEAGQLYDRYLAEIDASPFEYNEVCAVGFLTAAAARAGFLTLNEYDITKKSQLDKRKNARGRADLWISSGDRDYSFEFKRAWFRATVGNLTKTLSRARSDIGVIDKNESHYAAGVVIAYVQDESLTDRYHKFAEHHDVNFAFRIGPTGNRGAYLFFSLK